MVGALATALSTGLLLTTVLPTGLPTWILVVMSITAAGFACFDLAAYYYWPDECWPLNVVGLLNLLYCAGAIVASWIYLPSMTSLGMLYFSMECAIVIPLGVFELVVAKYSRRLSP